MKKLFTLILAVILACGTFTAGGFAETDPAEDPMMYYIPGVSQFYHADPNCRAVSGQLRPMQAFFPLSVASIVYPGLRPCKACGAPRSTAAVEYAPAKLFRYKVKADDTVEIISADSSISNGYIPAELDGHAVTSIGREAFKGCLKLNRVVLPATVTSIEDWGAFAECENLNSVYLPSSLTRIGDQAFQYADNLEEVIIPEGVTAIGSQVFFWSGLKSLRIPASLTSISDGCFDWCENLKTIEVAPGNPVFEMRDNLLVNKQEKSLFYYIDNGSETYEVPGDFEKIGEDAFFNTSLKEVIVPDSVKAIDSAAFFQARNLESVRLPAGLKEISSKLFSNCASLKSVVIPDGVTSIGEYAFFNCESLKEVVIPASVTDIDRDAFKETRQVTVKAPAGSYAQSFCETQGIKFEPLSE